MPTGATTILGGLILLALVALVGLPALFRLLWNTTVPELFGLKEITYVQSFKLLIMAWIVFGVFGLG